MKQDTNKSPYLSTYIVKFLLIGVKHDPTYDLITLVIFPNYS